MNGNAPESGRAIGPFALVLSKGLHHATGVRPAVSINPSGALASRAFNMQSPQQDTAMTYLMTGNLWDWAVVTGSQLWFCCRKEYGPLYASLR
jgi:hypothetical protein